MYCKEENCQSPVENHEAGLCSRHARELRKGLNPSVVKKRARIKHVSVKKAAQIKEYVKLKKLFFLKDENKICRVCGHASADSIHHAKGKIGYNDKEAEIAEITLLNDVRFWIPIHSFNINPDFGTSCHDYIELHPEFAKKINVSLNRLEK